MAQAQSKMIQEEYSESEYNDYLVLYIEEGDVETNETDMSCFVMYDDTEKEYLLVGLRKSTPTTGEQYKFYCKKRKNVLNYLNSVFFPLNETKVILYNFKNLNLDFDNESEFEQLQQNIEKNKEIIDVYLYF